MTDNEKGILTPFLESVLAELEPIIPHSTEGLNEAQDILAATGNYIDFHACLHDKLPKEACDLQAGLVMGFALGLASMRYLQDSKQLGTAAPVSPQAN